MSWSKRLDEILGWGEHVRLVFDVIAAIASWKVVKKLLSYIPQISHDWASIAAWTVAALILLGLVRWHQKRGQTQTAQQPASAQNTATTLIPATSAIIPGTPAQPFDGAGFFKTAYYSPVTAEVEKNIRLAANQNQPNDREAFLVRFIGVGVVSYLHEMTWASIYKSQFRMLSDMNTNNGWMTLASAQKYYDDAVAQYPEVYKTYSFPQWIGYMKGQQLLIEHPSNMLEITVRGKDFLKYLTHWGRSVFRNA